VLWSSLSLLHHCGRHCCIVVVVVEVVVALWLWAHCGYHSGRCVVVVALSSLSLSHQDGHRHRCRHVIAVSSWLSLLRHGRHCCVMVVVVVVVVALWLWLLLCHGCPCGCCVRWTESVMDRSGCRKDLGRKHSLSVDAAGWTS